MVQDFYCSFSEFVEEVRNTEIGLIKMIAVDYLNQAKDNLVLHGRFARDMYFPHYTCGTLFTISTVGYDHRDYKESIEKKCVEYYKMNREKITENTILPVFTETHTFKDYLSRWLTPLLNHSIDPNTFNKYKSNPIVIHENGFDSYIIKDFKELENMSVFCCEDGRLFMRFPSQNGVICDETYTPTNFCEFTLNNDKTMSGFEIGRDHQNIFINTDISTVFKIMDRIKELIIECANEYNGTINMCKIIWQ